MVDAILAYLTLGKVTSGTDWTIQGSVSGDVDQIIAHIENNQFAREQAREYYAKGVKGALGTGFVKTTTSGMVKCLTCNAEFVSPRLYDMTTDSVVQATVEPIFRGSKSPKIPYVVQGNANLALTWNSLTLSKFFSDFSINWENDIGVLLDETTSYWGSEILNGGHRKISDLTIEFVVPKLSAIGDLDNVLDYVDSTTSADIVLRVPRRHANDYLQYAFKNPWLKQFDLTPAPLSDPPAPRIAKAVFTGITDIEIIERTVTADEDPDANVAADYNQA
jgi:hypothetical protein